MPHRPRRIGIACAIGAVILGLVYLMIAGAPMGYLVVNAGALATGLAILGLYGRAGKLLVHRSSAVTLVLALVLFATALLGKSVDGAARWVDLGTISVQPSLVLLPIMIVSFAHSRDILSVTGLLLTTVALALQPDRAMAGMLFAGLAALATVRRDRFVLTALIGSAIGFAATLARPDTLLAVPFVDQILYSSFNASIVAGMVVLASVTLLIVPAFLGWVIDPDNRHIYGVFGAVWMAAILAAALGNYPTPVAGYSGAAVLGYVLSLITLPTVVRLSRGCDTSGVRETVEVQSNQQKLSLHMPSPA